MKLTKTQSIAAFFISIIGVLSTMTLSAAPATMSHDDVIGLVNAQRHAARLHALREDDALTAAAQAKLDDMFAKGYFAHMAPDGRSPWHWFSSVGYAYSYAGENLAMDFTESTKQHAAWMESQTHRKNILSPYYDATGVAIGSGTINGEFTTVTVQLFAGKGVEPLSLQRSSDQDAGTVRGWAGVSAASPTPEDTTGQRFIMAIVAFVSIIAIACIGAILYRFVRFRHTT